MSDREFVNKSLQSALQLIRDEATKPLHVEIERLRGALQQIVDAEGFDVNAAHFRQLALTALAGAAVQPNLARGCHRSHPQSKPERIPTSTVTASDSADVCPACLNRGEWPCDNTEWHRGRNDKG